MKQTKLPQSFKKPKKRSLDLQKSHIKKEPKHSIRTDRNTAKMAVWRSSAMDQENLSLH